jgi:hypothetical protein
MKIEVTYGQVVPAYLTESVDVPDEIANDKQLLLAFLQERALQKRESDSKNFELSWDDAERLRIVCAMKDTEILLALVKCEE